MKAGNVQSLNSTWGFNHHIFVHSCERTFQLQLVNVQMAIDDGRLLLADSQRHRPRHGDC